MPPWTTQAFSLCWIKSSGVSQNKTINTWLRRERVIIVKFVMLGMVFKVLKTMHYSMGSAFLKQRQQCHFSNIHRLHHAPKTLNICKIIKFLPWQGWRGGCCIHVLLTQPDQNLVGRHRASCNCPGYEVVCRPSI